jgi:L-threonylcarbamoyladenylate synthase
MTTTIEISKAAELLRAGGLVAFPTETVYGLGADAMSDAAVAKIYAAKGRPSFNPLIVHIAYPEQAFVLGNFDPLSEQLAAAFWPGPLTLVVPRPEQSRISRLASAGLPTIALRIPSHPMAQELLRAFGGPVVAPSANPSGRISPTQAEHVRRGLGEIVDLILDGGAAKVGVESTVIRIVEGKPHLLRAGGISRADIEQVIGARLVDANSGADLHSPGQLESHYAPAAPLRLNAVEPRDGEIFIGFGEHQHGPLSLSHSGDDVEAAANLFRNLHEADSMNPKGIAVAPIPMRGLGEAINDRLKRAAHG